MKKRNSTKNNRPESQQQMALVKWMKLENLVAYAIPNGGKRSFALAAYEKAMGLTAGVSDIFLSMPTTMYHGFYIEMKAPGKKPTPAQLAWFETVRKLGYKAEYYDDWITAKKAIENYLKEK